MNEQFIKRKIKEFTWYSPVDFGNGIIANGDFKGETQIKSIHFGLEKWKYIIDRNLPDLQGKRVLDIGCNNGIFCLQTAKMGATEVYGIDSGKTWPDWQNQADFTKKAIEWRCKTSYPITYIDSAMDKIPDLNLGYFDVVIALCCLYYLDEARLLFLLDHLKKNCDYLLIQCNTQKRDQPPEVHRRATPQFMANALKTVGFQNIAVDKPFFYERPIVVGSKFEIPSRLQRLKIDKLRHWVRSKI